MSNDISNYNNWLDAWNDFYDKEKGLVEIDANAALVSSVDAEGNPNARVILIKDVSNKGFVFYTNYQSQKVRNFFIIIKATSHGIVSTRSFYSCSR